MRPNRQKPGTRCTMLDAAHATMDLSKRFLGKLDTYILWAQCRMPMSYLCLACSTVFEMPSITVAGLVDRAKISALMTAHPLRNAVDQDELILSDRKESDVKAN